ncbi:MAG: pyridoxal 5'-phosphate synthase lyase subunit PdxS [Thermoplasmata archaeon]
MPVNLEDVRYGTDLIKRGFARMQKGGVIMDVVNAEQAKIAEDAGAVAVMALEKVPADIRASGGVARMADPLKIQEIMDAVSIPVMAKVRIGHTAEARALESMEVDMIDESEVLTPADPFFHIDKKQFVVPFVCGARNLGEAVRRIWEGAAMIRTKGEAGTGNVIEAVRHIHLVKKAIESLKLKNDDEIYSIAEKYSQNYIELYLQIKEINGEEKKIGKKEIIFSKYTLDEIINGLFKELKEIKKLGRLPVVNFAAGGVATPADAAFMMQMGMDGVFVGSGIFKSTNPAGMAKAIVEAVLNYDKPEIVKEVSKNLSGMKGTDISAIPQDQRLQERGW